jgi:hypothetical protein
LQGADIKNRENIDGLTALCLAAGIIERLSNDLKKKNMTTVQKTIAFCEGEKKKFCRDICDRQGRRVTTLSRCSGKSCTRIYIRTTPARCWTLVYIIEYVVHGKKINEREAMERHGTP